MSNVLPPSAKQLFQVGVRHHQAGRLAEAVEAYRRVLRLAPRYVPAHQNEATALRRLGRLPEALASIERGLALQPDAVLYVQRGDLLLSLDRTPEALEAFDQALARDDASAPAHNGRAAALGRLGQLDEALAAAERAIAVAPGLADAHRTRGVLLRRLRRPADAVAAFDRAVTLQPTNAEGYLLRSFCHLLLQNFEAGWRDNERRWEVGEFLRTVGAETATPALRERVMANLSVDDVTGRDILLVGEQGVGDVIMFASILPDLLAVARRVALVCDHRLRGLFAESFPALELPHTPVVDPRAFAVVIGAASLGRLFRNRIEDFPGAPYLKPSDQAVAKWAQRLGPSSGKRRIGLSWRGGIARTGQNARSLKLDQLGPVLTLPECEFVSLQYGDVTEELAAINASLASPIRAFPARDIDDFDDIAGLVLNLDLVVSVQTAVVHLTGALGAPGLAMLPVTPEWRYGAEADTMPWYRSVRLIRQATGGDWAPVLEAVAAEAAARLDLKPPTE